MTDQRSWHRFFWNASVISRDWDQVTWMIAVSMVSIDVIGNIVFLKLSTNKGSERKFDAISSFRSLGLATWDSTDQKQWAQWQIPCLYSSFKIF